MLRVLLIALLFSLSIAYGQVKPKKTTIPLYESVHIRIFDVDSTTFAYYIVYSFQYNCTIAKFWASRDDKKFTIGYADVTLCRIIQMKSESGLWHRGCSFYNGLIVVEQDSIYKHYKFDEYSESPTLRLCSTDK